MQDTNQLVITTRNLEGITLKLTGRGRSKTLKGGLILLIDLSFLSPPTFFFSSLNKGIWFLFFEYGRLIL